MVEDCSGSQVSQTPHNSLLNCLSSPTHQCGDGLHLPQCLFFLFISFSLLSLNLISHSFYCPIPSWHLITASLSRGDPEYFISAFDLCIPSSPLALLQSLQVLSRARMQRAGVLVSLPQSCLLYHIVDHSLCDAHEASPASNAI